MEFVMIKSISLNGQIIEYEFQRKNVKNINLRIKPDGSISLSANRFVSQNTVDEFLKSNAEKILSALDKFKSLKPRFPKEEQFEEGDTFLVFGEEKVLKPISGNKNKLEIKDGYAVLTVKDANNKELKSKTVEKWRREQCEKAVFELCKKVYPLFEKRGVRFPEIRIRKMKSRWGSCQSQKSVLTFNSALVNFPLDTVEYVVMHEFVHFLRADHSKEFYRILESFMPDWKERRENLKK